MILMCGGRLGLRLVEALKGSLRLVLVRPDDPHEEQLRAEIVALALNSCIAVGTAFRAGEKIDVHEPVIVAGWRKILPDTLVNSVRCYGIHWSLLPKYRGWCPLNWAIINGEKETGLSIFRLTSQMDAGDLLYQERVEIRPEDDAGTLSVLLTDRSVIAVCGLLPVLLTGAEKLTPQVGKPTYFPKRTPDDGELSLRRWPAKRITNMVRALTPPCYPGAFVRLGDGSKLIISHVEAMSCRK